MQSVVGGMHQIVPPRRWPFIAKAVARTGTAPCEDRVEVLEWDDALLIAIADGAGGVGNAADAADFVVTRVIERALSRRWLTHETLWCDALRDIDRSLSRSGKGGESTAVVVSVSASGIAGASVGDAGAWLIRPDGYDDLTATQVRTPFIGSGRAVPTPFRSGADEILLVATDGLLKYARPAEICRAAATGVLSDAAELLINCVRLRSGCFADDVALALVRRV